MLISDFSPGLRTDVPPDRVPPGGCADCENVIFERGSLKVRRGRLSHCGVPGTTPVLEAGIRALFEYVPVDGSDARLVAVIGNRVFSTDTPGQTFDDYIEHGTTVHSTNPVRFAQYGNLVYLVDGSAPVKKLFADSGDPTAVETLFGIAKPTHTPGVTSGVDGLGGSEYLETGDYEFYFAFSGDISQGMSTGPGHKLFVPAGSYKTLVIPLPASLEAEAIAAGAFHVRLYARTPYETMDLLLVSYFAPSPWIPGGLTLYAGVPAITAEVFSATRAAGVVTIGTVANHGFYVGAEVTVAGVPVEGLTTSCNGLFTITSVGNEQAFSYAQAGADGAATDPAGTASITARITSVSQAARTDNIVTIVTEVAHYLPVGAGVHVSGVPLGTSGTSFNGVFTITATTDTSFCYAQEAASDSVPGGPPVGGTASIESCAARLDDAETWRVEYLDFPPAGCSCLREWNGRMVYVGPNPDGGLSDTLYISNLVDPDHVPQGIYQNPPSRYGTTIPVGNDGRPITALALIGTALVVFKERGVFLGFENAPGSFELRQVSWEHGCVSQETIALTPGGLIYASRDSVWSFDGQSFRERGLPVAAPYQAIGVSRRWRSFAYYDPDHETYTLVIPES